MASQYFYKHSFKSTTVMAKAWLECSFVGWWLTWAIAFLACLNSQAQGYSYHPLPTQEQLPVANVNVIVQDHDGYMWYGTAGGGLCRDDGYEVVTYSSKNTGRGIMESDEITCMAEDLKGRMWFGTRAGLYYINNVEGTVQRVVNELVGQKKVNCIGVTSDGCVWAGVQRDVVKFSPEGTFVKALSIGDNPREETKEMMVDSRGKLWLTILRGGIVSIDPKTDRLTREPWNYPFAAGYMLEDTVRRCYWVGTWGGGIVQYPQMVPQPATMVSTENQNFGSEVYNLWIDQANRLAWVATMDDVYAYKIGKNTHPTAPSGASLETGESSSSLMQPYSTHTFMPMGKKLIGKLFADRRGNIWVPGSSPHTFILSPHTSGSDIRRNEVKAMTEQMGYKVMVHQIAREGDYYWIYQNRTRLSLYDPATNRLTFMATDASTTPSPLSTQRPLSRCKADKGVWTCNGKHLIHVWHEGMKICWEEIGEAQMPNYISALSDQGNGHLLIGTEKQVFLFDYQKKTLKPLTDSVGIVQQVGYDKRGKLTYTTDPKAPQVVTDKHGHVWTLNELTLQEYSPRTGASRVLKASDRNIEMDNFTDLTLVGDDSICVGGIGAYCMIGYCKELDLPHPDDRIVVTHYDTLHSISISTMNHLHAADIQFAYRINNGEWVTLPTGEHIIDISNASFGTNTLYVKATDEYGVWHKEQEVFSFFLPLPWYLRWYSWCIYAALLLLICRLFSMWKKKKQNERKNEEQRKEEQRSEEVSMEMGNAVEKEAGEEHIKNSEERERENFAAEVNEWIEKNLDNTDYGVNELCRDLGMSRMNLYRKFQRLSLPTPSEFIKSYRLQKAHLLLRTTDQSIAELAYAVGFTSPQYFAKCFKDEFGSTPSQWKDLSAD